MNPTFWAEPVDVLRRVDRLLHGEPDTWSGTGSWTMIPLIRGSLFRRS